MTNFLSANHYFFDNMGEKVEYFQSDRTGSQSLQIGGQRFSGDEIFTESTKMGIWLTVITEDIPDIETITESLLLPAVNIDQNKMSEMVHTQLIRTSHRSSISGAEALSGQVAEHEFYELEGEADFLVL